MAIIKNSGQEADGDMSKKPANVQEEAQENEGELVKATVAPRRSVVHENGDKYLPGSQIFLLPEEAQRLRDLGFLIDPAKSIIEVGSGPTYGQASGLIKANTRGL